MKNLVEALGFIAGETRNELLETLISPFFQRLLVYASDGITWALDTGRAKQHPQGVTIANWALAELHTSLCDGFAAGCRKQNDRVADDSRAIAQIQEIIARLLEAERRPMRPDDLTAAELSFINQWGSLIERSVRLAGEDDFDGNQPTNGNIRLLPKLNFIIWWGRHQGKLPRWFRPACRAAA